MSNTYLLFDCSYLMHRAFHSTGGLSHKGKPTGALFGFFRDLGGFQQQFRTRHVVFCFDSNKSIRKTMYPGYKKKRGNKLKEATPEERAARQQLDDQLHLLHTKYLYELGYVNLFSASGYEADDVIASLVHNTLHNDHCIIVSADKDLYQLLGERVSVFHPQKNRSMNRISFKAVMGIDPRKWPMVKAIAGCDTDEIKGVVGVGEKTAIKYMNNVLDRHLLTHQAIKDNAVLIKENLKLVELPLKGTPEFELDKDHVTSDKWRKVMKTLGIKSLKDAAPVGRF